MADEGVHEIQLNGKQLVFLFMSGTVVAVVIFLMGVMVGRGIRAPRAAQQMNASAETTGDPTAAARPPLPAPSAPTEGMPLASQETLTYPDRLEDPTPPPETLRDTPNEPVATAPAAPAPVAKASAAPPEPAAPDKKLAVQNKPAAEKGSATTDLPREPAGSGFVVQVAATRDRGEADAIAKRLAAKGYPTFVTTPGAGGPRVFRVRVGKFTNRREADTVAGKLEREEQFKPWITR
jgi:cell division septation protein DedD